MFSIREQENIRKQQSVFFYTEMVKYDPIVKDTSKHSRNLYTSMLIQDVCAKVLPYKNNVQVILTGGTEGFTSIIISGLNRGYDITSAIRNFLNMCIQNMFEYGESIYEIVYLVDPRTDSAVGFELSFIRPNTVFNFCGNVFQYVPPVVAKEYKVPIFIRLSKENIVRFSFNSAMKKTVKTTMKKLSFISENSLPPFSNMGINYSYNNFKISNQLVLAEITQKMGWNGRYLLVDNLLEFYQIYRYIKFAMFASELRDLLIKNINGVFQQIGRTIGHTGQIEVTGLVSREDLDSAMIDLLEGKRPFKEIYEKINA
jgi:hypothetical protein